MQKLQQVKSYFDGDRADMNTGDLLSGWLCKRPYDIIYPIRHRKHSQPANSLWQEDRFCVDLFFEEWKHDLRLQWYLYILIHL